MKLLTGAVQIQVMPLCNVDNGFEANASIEVSVKLALGQCLKLLSGHHMKKLPLPRESDVQVKPRFIILEFMTTGILFLIAIIILGFTIVILFLQRIHKSRKGDQAFLMLQNQINEVNKALGDNLNNTQQALQRQFSQSTQIIQEVTERLTKLDETNRQVVGFAEQLRSLENVLTNPKQRGILGEYFLETLLKNVLPPSSYQMQFRFKDGEAVDAVIYVKDRIIPVDSKFSLENYNRLAEERDPAVRKALEKQFKQDVKNRIDETAKYIRPNEKTMDFAFMFIPSEGIYYDLLVNRIGTIKAQTRDLIEYAFKDKHVIIVSPTSFFAYLQTVLQGLRALQIEQSAQQIRERVERLQKHLVSYDDYMRRLGNNLGTTVNMYNSAYREFKKVDKDVTTITEQESEIKPIEIDKPQTG
jgi:DNA recombination protein RmuC